MPMQSENAPICRECNSMDSVKDKHNQSKIITKLLISIELLSRSRSYVDCLAAAATGYKMIHRIRTCIDNKSIGIGNNNNNIETETLNSNAKFRLAVGGGDGEREQWKCKNSEFAAFGIHVHIGWSIVAVHSEKWIVCCVHYSWPHDT